MVNKKGVTPLVATILLVAFSVGLGALVMSWGEEYIEQKAEFVQGTTEIRSGCDVASLSIITIGGVPQACVGEDYLQLWIDNGADIDLFNIHARIVGSEDVVVFEEILEQPLLRSNAIKAQLPYNAIIGRVLQVRLTPKIWTGNEVNICSQSSINVEKLGTC